MMPATRGEGETMIDRRRRIACAAVAGAIALAATQHPHADLRLVTHDIGDVAPRRFQVAADLGIVAVSFLYTWTQRRVGGVAD